MEDAIPVSFARDRQSETLPCVAEAAISLEPLARSWYCNGAVADVGRCITTCHVIRTFNALYLGTPRRDPANSL